MSTPSAPRRVTGLIVSFSEIEWDHLEAPRTFQQHIRSLCSIGNAEHPAYRGWRPVRIWGRTENFNAVKAGNTKQATTSCGWPPSV
jgi:hypothetical protein